jgi:glycosyltransferase involved in cell wall biosynthesis
MQLQSDLRDPARPVLDTVATLGREDRLGTDASGERVALLTGGKDRHYVIGLLEALQAKKVHVECIAGDELATFDVVQSNKVDFHNFTRSQAVNRMLGTKIIEVLAYYVRLLAYAARTDARIFHVLWFRKFPRLERIFLTTYIKALGKKVVFTAHNVDAEARDGKSTLLNRLSLRFLYHAVDHILVHTERMKQELITRFDVIGNNVTVVPFGINDVIPQSKLTRAQAKDQLGFGPKDKVLLFFGTIVAYKGVEDLLGAVAKLVGRGDQIKLLIAGPVWPESREYWSHLEQRIATLGLSHCVKTDVRPSYLSDEDVALFFRAADVSILPYKRIYQSGVLALSYHQGLPVIAAAVGAFPEDVVDGKTGLLFRASDVADLASKIHFYFESDMYRELERNSRMVREYGTERFSWERNAQLTVEVYRKFNNINATSRSDE